MNQFYKNGNVLELRNGILIIVTHDTTFFKYLILKSNNKNIQTNDAFTSIETLTNFFMDGDKSFDIIKIYEDYTLRKVIWSEPKEFLTVEEKTYLRNLIKPLRHQAVSIRKKEAEEGEYIVIYCRHFKDEDEDDSIIMPTFETKKYYNGLILNKEYTIEELKL